MSNRKKGRPYEKIDRDVMAAIPDNLLASTMFDHIWLKVNKDYKRTPQVLQELPSGFSLVYHLLILDGEIGNGGFNQYFFNGLDSNAEQQLEALRLIEATKHQKVFQEAFRIHDEEKQNAELQRRYTERTIESFFSTYGTTMLEKCDKEWYALDEEFNALLVQFIRKHPELFVTEGRTE
jgi:hypothetical protein